MISQIHLLSRITVEPVESVYRRCNAQLQFYKISSCLIHHLQNSESMKMELKYPLARLSVLYQIHGKNRTCEEAMILAAYEGGLVSHGSLDRVNAIGHGSCGAMETARKIAEQKMKEVHGDDSDTVQNLAAAIINQVETGINRYLSRKESVVESHVQELNCLQEAPQTNCHKLAPIVIDLLIQQLRLH